MRELWQIFLSFFRIGMFTLGGGYAMLPLIQREVVEKRQWVDSREFIELLALAQTSPGPMAINAAVFVGYKHHGIAGSAGLLPQPSAWALPTGRSGGGHTICPQPRGAVSAGYTAFRREIGCDRIERPSGAD